MFDLKETNEITETISFRLAGYSEAFSFKATFKLIPRDEIDKLMRKPIKDVLEVILVGWDGLKSGGAELPFTRKNIALIANHPVLGARLVKVYQDSIHGSVLGLALEKNLLN